MRHLGVSLLGKVERECPGDGLVTRRAYATVPVTVEYRITPLGETLSTTLDALRL